MPKLPANLPENWTRGQIVSPNGTETGLTEQHGYNYLMKQVNNTQTEVNNINTALTDVAQQATVNEIKNKIGTEADADTQPTLFGRLAQLKKVLLEKLAEVLTKVTGIDGKIGTSEDTAGSATLFGQIKNIVEESKKDENKIFVPSDNVKKTLVNKEYSVTLSRAISLGKFYSERNGFIKVKARLRASQDNSADLYIYDTNDFLTIANGDTKLIWSFDENNNNLPVEGDTFDKSKYSFLKSGSSVAITEGSTSYKDRQTLIPVKKGSTYLFMLTGSSYTFYCNSLTLCYDEMEGTSL